MTAPADVDAMPAEELLAWAYAELRPLAIVASFQVESIVLIDLAAEVFERPEVITIDTGRLPAETHDLIDRVRRRWPIRLVTVTPEEVAVNEMVAAHGRDLFKESVDFRHLCCEIRKVRPLDRALAGYAGWVTGLRREQSTTRAGVPALADDPQRPGVAKLAPLAAWTHEEVWDRVHERDLPVNRLYQRGYTSIGCAPCTRATGPGEDERAGRWWWEAEAVKECGLHWRDGSASLGRAAS